MRIVYFGTSEFAVPALLELHDSIIHVVTQPDRPSGRGRGLHKTPVRIVAEDRGIPVSTPVRSRDDEFIAQIAGLRPDALLVASYGQILSQKLLDAAMRGGINLHASLLPKYRGAAPIQRAILEGECVTGVTLMQMDKGMDTGDIIATQELAIEPNETAGDLESRLASVAADLARQWMPRVVAGDYSRIPQCHSEATYADKMTAADGRISTNESVELTVLRVRACTPRPGARLRTRFGEIRIHSATAQNKVPAARPGTILGREDSFVTVAWKDGCIELRQVQPEGKKLMSAIAWLNGLRVKPGECVL